MVASYSFATKTSPPKKSKRRSDPVRTLATQNAKAFRVRQHDCLYQSNFGTTGLIGIAQVNRFQRERIFKGYNLGCCFVDQCRVVQTIATSPQEEKGDKNRKSSVSVAGRYVCFRFLMFFFVLSCLIVFNPVMLLERRWSIFVFTVLLTA